MTMHSRIMAIATALPSIEETNESLQGRFPSWDGAKSERKLGIHKRWITSEKESSLTLAERAGQRCLSMVTNVKPDYLLLCTQSPDHLIPATACVLQHRLGLGTSVGALEFNLGCSGYLYGLQVASALISSDNADNVLFVTADTYSKHLRADDISNRSIFGDGAAATLITRADDRGIGKFVVGTDGAGACELTSSFGGMANPYGAREGLYMNGPEILRFTMNCIPEVVKTVANKNGLLLEDVDQFIFHQANRLILQQIQRKLNIPDSLFFIGAAETGNTVSSTIPFAINEYTSIDKSRLSQSIMLVGFGVGYSWAGTIIKF